MAKIPEVKTKLTIVMVFLRLESIYNLVLQSIIFFVLIKWGWGPIF